VGGGGVGRSRGGSENKIKVALQRKTQCSRFVSLLFIFQTVYCLTSFQNRELDRKRIMKDDIRTVR
jgi:hypothetical protein